MTITIILIYSCIAHMQINTRHYMISKDNCKFLYTFYITYKCNHREIIPANSFTHNLIHSIGNLTDISYPMNGWDSIPRPQSLVTILSPTTQPQHRFHTTIIKTYCRKNVGKRSYADFFGMRNFRFTVIISATVSFATILRSRSYILLAYIWCFGSLTVSGSERWLMFF